MSYDRSNVPPTGTAYTAQQARELAAWIDGDPLRQDGEGRDIVHIGNGETGVLAETLRQFADMLEERSDTNRAIAKALQHRSERWNWPLDIPAGNVWIDRAMRATGNTTRMLHAAVRSAANGVTCCIIFPNTVHLKDIGEKALGDVLESYRHRDKLLIDGQSHDPGVVRRRIRMFVYRNVDAQLAGMDGASVFPDGSLVQTVLVERFGKLVR